MTDPAFIHLRVHSAYSLLEGALHAKDLVKRAAGMNMPAIAVTDTNNMFGALEFSEAAAAAGVQPVIGCQLDLSYAQPGRLGDRLPPPLPIVLLAQNETGYANLMKLNTCYFLGSDDDAPHASMDQISRHSEGLICLTGGADGPVGAMVRAGDEAGARALLVELAGVFPNRLYVELQRHPEPSGSLPAAEAQCEPVFLRMAYEHDLPIVATNDVYFADAEMFEAHDALICIADGTYVDQKEPRRRLSPEHRLKSPAEMADLFADLPEALERSVEIAKRCAFKATTRAPILPKFADDEVEELRRASRDGLAARLAVIEPVAELAVYDERLEFELKIIEGMGFPGYFLIVADFIKWAKERDIPVGPGRGSGAGSLVAYALTITDLDPLRYGLLFERFLNPERISMPDFDIDFCMDRREEVISYVQEKYGADRVAQIITFGALLSKAAVRDVGRVLQMPYGQVDRLSKMIPVEGVKPVSIDKALADEPRLREEAAREEVVARLLDFAGKLEGLYRNASTHAAGVVIGDRPLDELVPLYRDPRSDMPATQFNMKWVEAAGLVKFDFLGLKTLTVVQNAVDLLAARDEKIDIGAIPLNDPGAYEVYASANTVAVFQVESAGMRDALRQMKPDCIEDIIALVALYRPGPMENIPKFCKVKNGLEDREGIHPLIDPILDETQGIIVYQEQVMEIARKMAGYSLGGADMLRRAMGKKIQAAMDAEKPKFLAGAKENDVDAAKATEVWNLLDKFANYGFNKSHAAAYAVVSYQTAWLKANHPVEFMAAVMNCDLHLTDKLSVYQQEVERLGIEMVPPCINRSEALFSVDEGKVVYALGALKNVGVEAMRLIVAEREAGAFADLFDFARRVELRRIGKRPLEMLARAGAFDRLDRNRRKVFSSIDRLTAWSAACHEEAASGQASLFGEASAELPAPDLPMPEDWLPTERLAEEHMAVGFYLSGHPLDDYLAPLKRMQVKTYSELTKLAKSGALTAKIAGAVSGRQERKSARGNRFAFVQLSDPTGLYEATVFSDTLESCRSLLEPGQNVVLTVDATIEGDQVKLLVRGASSADDLTAAAAPAGIKVFINDAAALGSVKQRLDEARAESSRRGGPVNLIAMLPELPGEAEIALEGEYPLTPQIKGAIKHVPGVVTIEDF